MTTFSTESAPFVGDTHTDTGWLKFAVLPTAKKLGIATIIPVGDFGYLLEARKFLNAASKVRQRFGVDICTSVHSRRSAFHPSFHPSYLSDGTRQNRGLMGPELLDAPQLSYISPRMTVFDSPAVALHLEDSVTWPRPGA